jgi:hypothetical protein
MSKSASLPNFIVIGTAKSGTTSLYSYLLQHPDVYLPDQKELHYFTFNHLKENSNGPGDKEFLKYVCSTRQEYENHYLNVNTESAIGEVSPSYLYYSNVSDQIYTELGRVKIIILLRNPVQKAYSQYVHLLGEKRETLPFYDALMAEQSRIDARWLDIWRYAENTLYADRIKKYISVFSRENVKIVLFEDLVKDTEHIMCDLFNFLGVDPDFECDTSRVFNKSSIQRFKIVTDLLKRPNLVKTAAKKIVPEKIRGHLHSALLYLNSRKKPEIGSRAESYLKKYFKADIEEVQRIIGKRLTWLD